MAVTIGNTGSTSGNTSTPDITSFTVQSGATGLLVTVVCRGDNTVSSVVWRSGGSAEALSQLRRDNNSGNCSTEIWYRDNPTAATDTVYVTISAKANPQSAAAVEVSGSTTPDGANGSTGSASDPQSDSVSGVTVGSGEYILSSFTIADSAITVDYTEIFNYSAAGISNAASYRSANNSISYSGTSGQYAHTVCRIPATAGGTFTKTANLDAYIQSQGETKTTSLDAYVAEAGLTKTANLDAIVQAQGETKTANMDAVLEPEIVVALSDNIGASGENTTYQLTAPSGKSTSDFGGGRIQDDENPGDAVDLASDEYREDEWAIKVHADVPASTVFEFRVVLSDGTPYDTYDVTPTLTVSAAQVKTKTASLDAYIQAQGELQTASLDAYIQQQALTKTANLDAYIQDVITATANLDAYVQSVGETATADLDGYVQSVGETATADMDAIVQAVRTATANLDAYVQAVGETKTASFDALVQSAGETLAANLDALVQTQGETKTTDLDAYIALIASVTTSLDAIVKAIGETKTANLDAHVQSLGETVTADLDAILTVSTSLTASLDAYVQSQGETLAANLDAYVAKVLTATASLDAYVQSQGLTKTASLDAIVQAVGRTITASLDAYVQKMGRTLTTDMDAILSVSLARELEGFRWRDDDGSESGASWLADQDVDITRAADTITRLRTLVDVTGNAPAEGLKLQYRQVGGTWKDVPIN